MSSVPQESQNTKDKMDQWVAAQKRGERAEVDVYGKPSERQLRELENVRSLSKELQDNLEELESTVRIADVENQAMNPTAPMLDYSEDHEFISANDIENCYAEEDKMDAKEAERRRLTKGKCARTPIQLFYSGQRVFVTGGTGFLGKVLIEKLLRSCGDVNAIFLLVRGKKGKDPRARVHELLDEFVFERALDENPKGIHKVVPILGDMELPGLGISDQDRKTLTSKVTIIINAAATVKFDEKLFYEPPMSVEALEAVSSLDENLMKSILPTLLGQRPNTYCLTKAVAEEAVRIFGEGMPICIVRPSIVVSSYEEPVRGWTDSVYGPTGLVIGIGTGVLRTMYMNQSKVADMVPVDLCVNAILASAWHTATNFKENQTSHIPIYNFVSGAQNPITWGEFICMNRKYGIDKPTTKAVWYYGLNPTNCYYMFLFYNFFLHFLPAVFVDLYCAVTGRRRVMRKLYNKVMKMAHILFYFSTQDWRFSNNGVRAMWGTLSEGDRAVFPFNVGDMSWEYLCEVFLVGLRVYLLKDDLSTLPEARKKWNRLFYIHQTLKVVTVLLVLNILYLVFRPVVSAVF